MFFVSSGYNLIIKSLIIIDGRSVPVIVLIGDVRFVKRSRRYRNTNYWRREEFWSRFVDLPSPSELVGVAPSTVANQDDHGTMHA